MDLKSWHTYGTRNGERRAVVDIKSQRIRVFKILGARWAREQTFNLGRFLRVNDMFWNHPIVWSHDGTKFYVHASTFKESIFKRVYQTVEILECDVTNGSIRVIWSWDEPTHSDGDVMIGVYCVDPERE